ncbi:MAG: RDD family protein [Pseudonocardia sp.]|nr:RDD family protein [Pseudonocardia sp.]
MDDGQTDTHPAMPTGPDSFPATGPNALARPWTRAVARLADTFIVAIPFLFIVLVVLSITGHLEDQDFPLWVRPLLALVAVAYEVPLLAWRGQTLGKLALGIKVARLDNGRPPLWHQAAMRIGLPGVLMSIPHPLGIVAASAVYFSSGWNTMGRGVHDKAAGTVVVASR